MENTVQTVKTYPVQGIGEVNITVADAVKVITQAFKDDPAYRYSWEANIAMAFKDNMRWHFSPGEIPVLQEDLHKVANKAADYFLDLLSK